MTEKESIISCRITWLWLSENPDKGKFDCPELQYIHYQNWCPCCEYSFKLNLWNTEKSNCSNCPLIKYAWKDELHACECDMNSPYLKWSLSQDLIVRREAAFQIVAACDKALEALENKT